jgi:hypothetical protein
MEEYGRYTQGFAWISIGILAMVWWIVSQLNSYHELDEQNTIARSGTLSIAPRFDSIVVDKKKQYYCELKFRGSDDVFWFIDCSYREGIEKELVKLFEGDSLMLFVKQWKGSTYQVVDAQSANYKLRYNFYQFNRCAAQDVAAPNPWFAEFCFALGLILITMEYISEKRDEHLAAIPTEELLSIKLPMKLSSDPFIYVVRTLTYPLAAVALAVYFFTVDENKEPYLTYALLAAGCGLLINNIVIAFTITYVIDEEGVEATTNSLFSRKSARKMRFQYIDDVSNVTSFLERRRKVGTIRLSRAEEDDEPPLRLIGIRDPLRVGRIIFELAVAKRAGKS